MKKNLFFFFLFAMAGLMLSGCEDTNCCMQGVILVSDLAYLDNPPSDYVWIEVPSEGKDEPISILVTCNMKWRLVKEADFPEWIEVSDEYGEGSTVIEITVGPAQRSLCNYDEGIEGYPLVFKAANGDVAIVEIGQCLFE